MSNSQTMSNHFAWSVPNEGDCLCFSRSVLASKLLLCFSLFFLLGLIQRVFCLSSATQSLHMANHFKQDGSIMALFTNHKIFNQFTNPGLFYSKESPYKSILRSAKLHVFTNLHHVPPSPLPPPLLSQAPLLNLQVSTYQATPAINDAAATAVICLHKCYLKRSL